MGMQINTNIMAVNARNNLAATNLKMGKALEKLSSGLRINRAADDAAGLAVSEKLRAQVKGLSQASRNAQDGISMIQTAEGALNETHVMLQRMRELSVQASNDTLSGDDRGAINTELQQLKSEINNISTTTKFNGKSLLNGSLTTTLGAASTANVGTRLDTTANSTISAVDVSNAKAGTTFALTSTAAGTVTMTRASDSVAQTITLSAVGANATGTLDFSQLGVKLSVQADTGGDTAANLATDLAGKNVVTAAGSGSANIQTGAYAGDSINVSFSKVDTSTMGVSAGDLDAALTAFNGSQTVAGAQTLITQIDEGIKTVNSTRATLGAYQNRLEHTITSLGVAVENLSASESRIRDTDVAEETSRMVTAQILTQAGTSVLSQANQAPQGALSLLRG